MDHSPPGLLVHHQLQSLFTPMSIKSVMPSNHLILCCPLLLPPSINPSIRVFSDGSVLHIRWPKYYILTSCNNVNTYYRVKAFDKNYLEKKKKNLPGGFPSGSVIKNPPANDPWSRKITHASEQLSPHTTRLKRLSSTTCPPQGEKPHQGETCAPQLE